MSPSPPGEPRRENKRDAGGGAAANGAVHVLVYRIDDQECGLLLADVERVVRAAAPTPLQDAPDTVLGIINMGGRVVPIVNMRRKLGLPERGVEMGDQFVIARTTRQSVVLVVDSVKGVIQRSSAEVTNGTEVFPGVDNLKGVIKLPDGLILIHDLDRCLFPEEKDEPNAIVSGN